MLSEWIGRIHKGQVGKSWSPREKAHKYDSENKLCNAVNQNPTCGCMSKFSTEPTTEDWSSSIQ